MLKEKTTTNRNVVVPACRRVRNRICCGARSREDALKQANPRKTTQFSCSKRERFVNCCCDAKRKKEEMSLPHTYKVTGSGAALNEDNVERVSPPATTGDHHRGEAGDLRESWNKRNRPLSLRFRQCVSIAGQSECLRQTDREIFTRQQGQRNA